MQMTLDTQRARPSSETQQGRILAALEEAVAYDLNLGPQPEGLSIDQPATGWVSAVHFVESMGVYRFGGRLFELRRDYGHEIETHEHRVKLASGQPQVRSWYRLMG